MLRKIAANAMIAIMASLLPEQTLLAQTAASGTSGVTGAAVTGGAADIARTGNVTNINQSTERA